MKRDSEIGYRKVGYLLEEMGYSLQMNQKMNQAGEEHPDRDEQFQHINQKAKAYGAAGFPVISIDCKKKELVGRFKNNGSEYAPKGKAVEILDHDFPLPGLGKAAPYGVYDMAANEGFVNVGRSCLSGGLLNAPWPGSTIPADFPKIMRDLFALSRLFILLLLCVFC